MPADSVTSPDGVMRASDADRERVVAVLREAYAAGRLTLEEFGTRVSAAFAARTWGELRQLTADLPAGQPLLPVPRRPGQISPQPARAGGTGWAVPLLPLALVWLAVAISAHDPALFLPVVVLLLAGLRTVARFRQGHSAGTSCPSGRCPMRRGGGGS